MPFYFNKFPKINYDIKKNNNPVIITNPLIRFKIRDILKNKSLIYFQYNIKDGERADTLAFKYYKDESLAWLIFITNDIIDPYYDWPLGYDDLNKYIKSKYGSIANAHQTVHHYEWIIQVHQNTPDRIIPEKSVEVDLTTYTDLLPVQRRLVSNYDYEEKENFRKSQIKILDKKYVPSVLSQIVSIL